MWKMQTTVNKNLYDAGYYLEGEGNRVDIVDPWGEKCQEIFFLGEDILIMWDCGYQWSTSIREILVGADGKPYIDCN